MARVVGTTFGRRIVASVVPPRNIRPAPRRTPGEPRPQQAQGDAYRPPVCLFSEVAVAAGSEAPLRSAALSNSTGKPVEIHEIRVAGLVSSSDYANVDLGSILRLSLMVDGKPVTHGFVPFWLLGRTEEWGTQVCSNLIVLTSWAQYTWRLSRPWYLRPGAKIMAQVQHTGGIVPSVRAQVALVGKQAAGKQTSFVPYASAWTGQPYQAATVAVEDSNENDLANVTKRALDVDRLIARVATRVTGAAGTTLLIADRTTDGGISYQIVTSRGEILTSSAIQPGFVAPNAGFGPRRSIEARFSLPPGDYLRASIRKAAVTVAAVPGPVVDWQAQAFLGLLGSREEEAA